MTSINEGYVATLDATGVIEGTCRHLSADRFEITGARWYVRTAEGIVRLRAIRSSGDWKLYQALHKKQERRMNHPQRFHESEMKAMVGDRSVVPKEPQPNEFIGMSTLSGGLYE